MNLRWILLFRMNKERETDDSDCVTVVVELEEMDGHEHYIIYVRSLLIYDMNKHSNMIHYRHQ